jgi:hypothetical protein
MRVKEHALERQAQGVRSGDFDKSTVGVSNGAALSRRGQLSHTADPTDRPGPVRADRSASVETRWIKFCLFACKDL